MEEKRRIAIDILAEFEELLNEHNIKIPSEDREGNEEEACLYGSEYYQLEDSITKTIDNIRANLIQLVKNQVLGENGLNEEEINNYFNQES